MYTKLYYTEGVPCSAMIYSLFKSYFSIKFEIFYYIKCTPVPELVSLYQRTYATMHN